MTSTDIAGIRSAALPPVMAPKGKPLHLYGLHDWQGTEHSEDCPRHPKNAAAEYEKYNKAKAEWDKGQSKLKPEDRRPYPPIQLAPCIQTWKTDESGRLVDACCPADLVVFASDRPLILQAEANTAVRQDNPRIECGDRRRGEYYVRMIGLQVGTGIQRVVDIAETGDEGRNRLIELEVKRQQRTGERPADWVIEARDRAARGHDPRTADNVHVARATFNSVARTW